VNRDWTAYAACRDEDPELWFADDAPGKAAAVRICAVCAVAGPCLVEALRTDGASAFGIRAGLSGAQRVGLSRVGL